MKRVSRKHAARSRSFREEAAGSRARSELSTRISCTAWAIKKVIFQAAVEKTTAFLEKRQGTAARIPTCPVSTVGRDWDDWLDKEIEVLTGKLDDGIIDQAIYDRRVSLLEARWSENV